MQDITELDNDTNDVCKPFKEIIQLDDGWTIKTADLKPSAHFEHTVVVRKGKAEILSSFDFIDEVLRNKN